MARAPVVTLCLAALLYEYQFTLDPPTFALFLLVLKYVNLALYFVTVQLPVQLFDPTYYGGDLLNAASIHQVMTQLEAIHGGWLIEQTLLLPFIYQWLRVS
jgi:hypothetical protein